MDALFNIADITLRTLFAKPAASAPAPSPDVTALPPTALSSSQRRESGALMRVNHVGEVCAQALYAAQGAVTANPALREQFQAAGREETDHLAWTRQRLDALGARPSLLNPLWYTGAFMLGLAAGRAGDAISLAFVAETEQQVGKHLAKHLARLPAEDLASRAIVARMRDDELRHAAQARQAGAAKLPLPVRTLMRVAAKVMTVTAHRI
jgi:ubiquinone biosynthesis monooxygenase Coq7